jgi:hypothetical protein
MASVHETAEGLHAAGVMDKRTMREFDDRCLTPVRLLRPKQIRALRLAGRRQPGSLCPPSQRDNGLGQPVGTRRKVPTRGLAKTALSGC